MIKIKEITQQNKILKLLEFLVRSNIYTNRDSFFIFFFKHLLFNLLYLFKLRFSNI